MEARHVARKYAEEGNGVCSNTLRVPKAYGLCRNLVLSVSYQCSCVEYVCACYLSVSKLQSCAERTLHLSLLAPLQTSGHTWPVWSVHSTQWTTWAPIPNTSATSWGHGMLAPRSSPPQMEAVSLLKRMVTMNGMRMSASQATLEDRKPKAARFAFLCDL